MQIESIAPDRLRPYANNARKHSAKQIGQIAKSIKRLGFCNPVLIDDNNGIVAGHGRVLAARQLGLPTIPVVRLSHLSETDKRAYILADNKLAENAGWDRDLLAIELQGLIDLDFDVDVTGYEPAELRLIFDQGAKDTDNKLAAEDRLPDDDATAVVTQINDLWSLGNHRLLCADPQNQASYDALLEKQKAQFVFTTPVNIASGQATAPGANTNPGEFLKLFFELLVANTSEGSVHMIAADWRRQIDVLTAGQKVYSEPHDLCIWANTVGEAGTFYLSHHELIYVWQNGNRPVKSKKKQPRRRSNIWEYPPITSASAAKPIKPVALLADALKDGSAKGDLVLDPFLGFGSLLIAAESTDRCARAIETTPMLADLSMRRWQNYTGKSAIHVATGETFQQRREKAVSLPIVMHPVEAKNES